MQERATVDDDGVRARVAVERDGIRRTVAVTAYPGDRTVVDDEPDADGDEPGMPPEDVEAMRAALIDMLGSEAELENFDDRLAAMIARIVEAYGRYNSIRGPSYSSYQALKAMALEGRGLAWLPQSLVADELRAGTLVPAGPAAWDVPVEIRLYRQRTEMSDAAEAFWRLAAGGPSAGPALP